MKTGGRKVAKADLLELARALGDEEVLEGESMLCILERCLDRARELNAPTYLFATRPPHPKVREWCAQLMDYAEERRRAMVADDERAGRKPDSDGDKWTWYTVFGMVRDSTGRPCAHNFAPGAHTCMRGNCHVHIDEIEVDASCSHKFVDSKACLLCGVTANVLRAKQRREAEQLAQLPPLALTEDRTAEQLKADGDDDDDDEPCPGRARGDGRQPGPCQPMAQEKTICLYCGRPIINLSDLRPAANADRVRALLEEKRAP